MSKDIQTYVCAKSLKLIVNNGLHQNVKVLVLVYHGHLCRGVGEKNNNQNERGGLNSID